MEVGEPRLWFAGCLTRALLEKQACDGYIRMTLDNTRAEPIGTLRIEKLRMASSVQKSMNYSLTTDGARPKLRQGYCRGQGVL